jgi:ABC-type phosphate transport system substrate-binding protein
LKAPRRLVLAFLLALWLGVPRLFAGEPLAVIVAAGSPLDRLSPETVRLIFNRKSLVSPQGHRWIPLNLPAADPLRRTFSLAVFDALPEDLEEYWNNQYFHGINPPEVLASEEAVLRFVAATPGAIGYVRAPLADGRVKVVLSIPVPAVASKAH